MKTLIVILGVIVMLASVSLVHADEYVGRTMVGVQQSYGVLQDSQGNTYRHYQEQTFVYQERKIYRHRVRRDRARIASDPTIISDGRAILSAKLKTKIEKSLNIRIRGYSVSTGTLVAFLLKVDESEHGGLIDYLWDDYVKDKEDINSRLPIRLRTVD